MSRRDTITSKFIAHLRTRSPETGTELVGIVLSVARELGFTAQPRKTAKAKRPRVNGRTTAEGLSGPTTQQALADQHSVGHRFITEAHHAGTNA